MDIFLTRLIYQLPHTTISNAIAHFLSFQSIWILLWFPIIGLIFIKIYQKNLMILLMLSSGMLTTYLFVEYFFKPFFDRPRPFSYFGIFPPQTAPYNYPNDFSFPSLHTALAFNAAYILSSLFPRYSIVFYAAAVCVAFSRIYLGYHYALDIIGGAIIGILFALTIKKLMLYETQRKTAQVA